MGEAKKRCDWPGCGAEKFHFTGLMGGWSAAQREEMDDAGMICPNADQHGELEKPKPFSAERMQAELDACKDLSRIGSMQVPKEYCHRLLVTYAAEKERADKAEALDRANVALLQSYVEAQADSKTLLVNTIKERDQLKADIAEACRISNATLPDDFPHSVDAGPAAAILRAKLEEARERAIRAETASEMRFKRMSSEAEGHAKARVALDDVTREHDQLQAQLQKLASHFDLGVKADDPNLAQAVINLSGMQGEVIDRLQADYAVLHGVLQKLHEIVAHNEPPGRDLPLEWIMEEAQKLLASPHPGADLPGDDPKSRAIINNLLDHVATDLSQAKGKDIEAAFERGALLIRREVIHAIGHGATFQGNPYEDALRQLGRVKALEGGIDDMLHASPCHSGEDYNRMPRHHVERLRDLIHGKSLERAEPIKETPSQELARRASVIMVEQNLTCGQATEYVLKTQPALAKAYREYVLKGIVKDE